MTDQSSDPLRPLLSHEDVEQAITSNPIVVLFKHSPLCGTSSRARKQVAAFAEQHTAIPVFVVDVVEERNVSRYISERLGIRHQSPQVIVMRDGRAIWNASHFRVTTRAITREVERP